MEAMQGVRKKLLRRSASEGLLFVGELTVETAAAKEPGGGHGVRNSATSGAKSGWKVGWRADAKAKLLPSEKMDHLVCFLPGLLALGHLHGVETGV